MLDRVAIAARIPHQGSMCLLDAVLAWDSGQIHCRASSHRQPDNPLRAAARLGAACGIEYAAQAMAVHGALLAPSDRSDSRVRNERVEVWLVDPPAQYSGDGAM